MLSSRRILLFAVFVIISCLALPVQSAVRYVKADSPGPTLDGSSWNNAYHTVTAALTAALSGDEIWVAKGTYVENITLRDGVALYGGFAGTETLRSERNWTTNQTILDGNKAGSVVTVPIGATLATVIDGFIVRNGKNYYGGGIYCNQCSPTISNNTITSNNGDYYGGGIYYYGSPKISNNTIASNTSYYGGGIYCVHGSSAQISNNTITSNRATYSDGGSGIYCVNASPRITNNTIASNVGQGICCTSSSAPIISNNIVAFNSSGIYASGSNPTLGFNCVYGNTSYNYSTTSAGATDISVDPLFVNNAGGDYHLTAESPCFHAGDDSFTNSGDVDMDGQTRVMGLHVDIGADEIEPSGSVVPRPVFDKTDPVINNPISVVITCPDPDAVIHYTTNGNQPAETDPVIASGDSVQIAVSTTLKARAFKTGMIPSGTATSFYRAKAATPTFEPDGGTYSGTQRVRISCITSGAIIHYTTTGVTPTESDPTVVSGSEIEISRSLPLMAKAWKTSWDPSDLKSANYLIAGRNIIHVRSGGYDSNDGMSWGQSKATIKAAIQASVPGMEIWVAKGTYMGNVALKDGVALYGGFAGTETSRDQRNWKTNQTILDGNKAGSVVTSPYGATASTVVDGFTICNGSANSGGGIYCYYSSPTISNNVITSNYAISGGGIYCVQMSSPTISNNIITLNTAAASTFGGGSGGGIYCMQMSSPTISGNTITTNCAGSGAGIYCYGESSPIISNNTIASNSSDAVFCVSSSAPVICNNIVAFNYRGLCQSGSTPTIDHNCVYGNLYGDHSGLSAGTGDISVDPRIAPSASGAWHIQPNSPCRNSGNNSAPGVPSVDFDGQVRSEGSAIDIGADESYGETWTLPVVYVTPTGNNSNNGLSWGTAKRTVQAAISACPPNYEVWVAKGTYVENITLKDGVALYGGFAGNEVARTERNPVANQTTLDGNKTGSVVTVPSGVTSLTKIDGFIIRNGTATNGGGIYCISSSPVISDNVITSNTASEFGGGIEISKGSPTIYDNTIDSNSAGSGGGIFSDQGTPIVSGNSIISNTAAVFGGGIAGSGSSSSPYSSSSSITNNTIICNTATEDGGGIACFSWPATLSNNIVAFNSSGIYKDYGGYSPILRNNDVYGNRLGNYSGLSAGSSDISVDPMIAVSASGVCHIQPNSPCRNAGDGSALGVPSIDIDGQARPEGSAIDIGADESYGEIWDPTVIYVSPNGDDNNDGLSWTTAKKTIKAAIDRSAVGMEIWVAKGTYVENITLKGGVALYGGFTGTETSRDQRSWKTNETIIDGNKAGSVVTSPSTSLVSAKIDGFTIRNGAATNGGGIYCTSSLFTISNNSIVSNTASYSGGGIYCQSASAKILNNSISSNNATGSGGGVYCAGSFSPTISNNAIVSNTSNSYGGGIYCSTSAASAVSNNIVAFNSSGIYCSSGTLSPTLRNNDVYGNGSSNYYGLSAGASDISVNPLVAVSANGACHIQPNSPCRDAGDGSIPGVPSVDIDGQARPEGSAIDIGADESYGETWDQVIIYVSPNGDDNNDGLNWTTAKKTIKAAINRSAVGMEIWVAKGTYVENITLKGGVALYGGFTGTETSRDQRNWSTNETIIDGNKAGNVVTSPSGITASTIIDGFTIRNGKSTTYNINGSGIYCDTSSCPTITHNTITANSATYGGGICCYYGSPTISNNTITSNTTTSYGGGIYCSGGSPVISNNTIVGNVTTGNTTYYGNGIYCSESSPTISNNIVAFNPSGIYCVSGTPTLRCNCVYGNISSNYSGITPGTGDISVDPMIAGSATGVCHIQSNSPCRNAGDGSAPAVPSVDIDGQVRPEGSAIDIGSDESYGETWTSMTIHVSPSGNDSNDGLSWSSAKKTIKAGLTASSPLINEIWVSAGTYVENITLKAGVSLYGGFAGNEAERNQRNWTANQTIIDGNQAGSVITSPSGVTASTRIDGFTIRNGKSSSSGGIYCTSSSPTITNNIITSNTGGGIGCYSSSPAICGNTITANTATTGAGIYCYYSSSVVSNNTISANVGSTGGGIYLDYGSSTSVSNNIVAFNGSGIYKAYYSSYSPTLRNNDVYGNTKYNYSGLTAGTGSISVDPLFVNRTAGDYHLLPSSLCINAGWNSALGLPSVDIDGQNRILGAVIDVGADEYQPLGDLATISGAKKAALGCWIESTGDIVTASMGDAFYIETENRASGIRVEKPAHTMARSMRSHVFGKVKTNSNGEVYIEASIAEQKGSETGTVTPLALTNRALGGSTLGLQAGVKDGAGLNNIGLLVRVCGKVVEIDQSATPTWFVIDDGSNAAVKCFIPSGVTIDASSERVCVTGISSCEKVGAELHRIIRVRDAKDIASY